MLLQRYIVWEKEDIKPDEKGSYVKLEDVMKLLEDAKLIDIDGHIWTTDYEEGWNAGIDALITELKEETK